MLKAYKYRIYPNNFQKEQINKTFGCTRFVYNSVLAYKKEVYEKEHKCLTKVDLNNYCNRVLKNEYVWLREIDKFALTNSIYNMDNAFNNFLKNVVGIQNLKVNEIIINHILLITPMEILVLIMIIIKLNYLN